MTRKIHSYEGDDVVVEYDAGRCIHAEECVHGLPGVFDPEARPWIRPGGASDEVLARVIERCPTGALHLRGSDGLLLETAPSENAIRIDPDGPLYLRGRLHLGIPGGETMDETRAALCRCGLSGDKPFCDGSHASGGFRDEGRIVENRLRGEPASPVPDPRADDGSSDEARPGEPPAPLEVTFATNGPVLISGPVEVLGTDGQGVRGSGGALCRCGHSGTKPFCDGTHKEIGFQAD